MQLSELLKFKREKKQLLMREVASLVAVDTAIISKVEKGERRPTKEQLLKYATALDIDYNKLLTLWYSEKIYQEIKEEPLAISILKTAKKRIKQDLKTAK